jgi:integrase/recombinase XerD
MSELQIMKLKNSLGSSVLDKLTEEEIQKIAKLVIIDQAKTEMKMEIKKISFDYETRKADFLNRYNAIKTKKAYRAALKVMENYIAKEKIDFFDFEKSETVDRFINFVISLPLSSATIRQIIAGISSFFAVLTRWNVIDRNCFTGIRRPKKQRVKKMAILTDEDYQKMLEALDRQGTGRGSYKRTAGVRSKWQLIFRLLYETGLRSDAVKSIQIGQSGSLRYHSKGKDGFLNIDKKFATKLRVLDFSKITVYSIAYAMRKACNDAKLETVYQPHSFRHCFAIKQYKIDCDIYRLMHLLNHSSISSTENYLKTLGIQI